MQFFIEHEDRVKILQWMRTTPEYVGMHDLWQEKRNTLPKRRRCRGYVYVSPTTHMHRLVCYNALKNVPNCANDQLFPTVPNRFQPLPIVSRLTREAAAREHEQMLNAMGEDGPNEDNMEHWLPMGVEMTSYQKALLTFDVPLIGYRHQTVNVRATDLLFLTCMYEFPRDLNAV